MNPDERELQERIAKPIGCFTMVVGFGVTLWLQILGIYPTPGFSFSFTNPLGAIAGILIQFGPALVLGVLAMMIGQILSLPIIWLVRLSRREIRR